MLTLKVWSCGGALHWTGETGEKERLGVAFGLGRIRIVGIDLAVRVRMRRRK